MDKVWEGGRERRIRPLGCFSLCICTSMFFHSAREDFDGGERCRNRRELAAALRLSDPLMFSIAAAAAA